MSLKPLAAGPTRGFRKMFPLAVLARRTIDALNFIGFNLRPTIGVPLDAVPAVLTRARQEAYMLPDSSDHR